MTKNILRKLKPDEYFYLHDGKVIKSIEEFPLILKDISDDTFRYHVNPEINDFANWIKFLSDDADFVAKVEKCLTMDDMINAANVKINSLKKVTEAVKKVQEQAVGAVKLKAEKKPLPKKPRVVKKKAAKKKAAPKKRVMKRLKIAEKKAVAGIKTAEKKVGERATEVKEGVIKKINAIIPTKARSKSKLKRAPEYLTAGIREYLLGIITGLILGLILSSFI